MAIAIRALMLPTTNDPDVTFVLLLIVGVMAGILPGIIVGFLEPVVGPIIVVGFIEPVVGPIIVVGFIELPFPPLAAVGLIVVLFDFTRRATLSFSTSPARTFGMLSTPMHAWMMAKKTKKTNFIVALVLQKELPVTVKLKL
jgi:hypothetical protein